MSTEGFTRVWNAMIDGIARTRSTPHPTDALESLLERLYDEAVQQPRSTRRLLTLIGQLLRYLGSTEGRTHDNLWVTSNFLDACDDWEVDWANVSETVADLLSRTSMEMSEVVDDPDWAKNTGAFPEELLARLKAYEANDAG